MTNNVMEKKVFIENPFGSVPEHILAICACVGLWFGNSFLTKPIPDLALIAIFGAAYAKWLLVTSIRRKLTIKCDGSGCEVKTTHFWKRTGTTHYFKWNEVTATKFERFADAAKSKPMFFWVVASGKENRLLQRSWLNSDQMESFLALVNQATPQLPYVWIRNDGNPAVLEKVGKFIKVPRNLLPFSNDLTLPGGS